MVIDRWECVALERLVGEGVWLLVYGRRKTGKTWLLRRCVSWSVYATVTRSGECIVEDAGGVRLAGLDECLEMVTSVVRRSGIAVIDEFQRLPQRYWDVFSILRGEAEGVLVACGSSMGIVSRIFDRRSPLLGVFEAFRVDLASVYDVIVSLGKAGLDPRNAVLWAVVVRDPWILGHVAPRGNPWAALAEKAEMLVPIVRGLVGEVFEEEERQLTRTYDAVLTLLAKGYWKASDIAARLYAAGLTSSPSASVATGILHVLEEMGLVERIALWRTRGARVYYRHRSPLTSLLYRIADMVEEAGTTPPLDTLRAVYGVELQFTLGELLAEYHGLRRAYSIQPDGRDVDVVLLDRRGRVAWGYEVKMGQVKRHEASGIAEWMRGLGVPRVGVVALGGIEEGYAGLDEVLTPEDILVVAERLAAEKRRTARRADHTL
ncbi:hypothetical protein Pyrfu_0644 [Pyrolobus fumarii 1A]|uniref:ATPase n=1 Tax=Pyrolobus fumarii (strain DSM 11204 / 1A) TaxID=694429 RepID=G0EHD8_PYRF1|nr:hypothetical protein Pyrfu_0644 [Pyrolobus fumarii 1A]